MRITVEFDTTAISQHGIYVLDELGFRKVEVPTDTTDEETGYGFEL